MSMYQIEDFVEVAIRAAANSDLATQQKRSLIHTLLEMESYGDCSFTNLRTIDEMIACSYSFAFKLCDLVGYGIDENSEKIYYYNKTDKYYIDSGSDAWQKLVNIGAVTGEGALAVQLMPFEDALEQVKQLLGEMDDYTKQGYAMLSVITGMSTVDEDEEIEYNPTTYEICGKKVKFELIAEINSEFNFVCSGYETSSTIMLYGKEIPFEFKFYFPEPTNVDISNFNEQGILGNEKAEAEHMSKLLKLQELGEIAVELDQYLLQINASPQYFSMLMELSGYKGEHKIEKFTGIVHSMNNGLKSDYYFNVTAKENCNFDLHIGSIVEKLNSGN